MEQLIKKFTDDLKALAPGDRAAFIKNLSLAGQSLNATFVAERRSYAQDAITFAESNREAFAAFAKK